MGQAESVPATTGGKQTVTVTAPPIEPPPQQVADTQTPADIETFKKANTTYYYTDDAPTTGSAETPKQDEASTPAETAAAAPTPDPDEIPVERGRAVSDTPGKVIGALSTDTPDTPADAPVASEPAKKAAPAETASTAETKEDAPTETTDKEENKEKPPWVVIIPENAAADAIWLEIVQFASPYLPDTVMMKWDAVQVCRLVCGVSEEGLETELIRRRNKAAKRKRRAQAKGVPVKLVATSEFEVPWTLAKGMLERDQRLNNLRRKLVPAFRISEEMFWRCYFERVIEAVKEHVTSSV